MDYDKFVSQVQNRAGFEDRLQAENAIATTFETLGERLYRTDKDQLAAQLPGELKTYLMARQEPGPTRRHVDRFDLEEFINRISARSGLGYPQARKVARVVMAVLAEALPASVLQDAFAELPDEFKKLM
jgi:uncharacterized protein (DUF2267 family)